MSDIFGSSQRLCNDFWTPKSLFKTCLDYVAKNISLVESLEHFPEIVGHQIFMNCIQYGYFTVSVTAERIIHLFVSAYRQIFMQSFQCHNLQLITEFCESIMILCLPLTHLDLHGCLLGNNNDILRALVDIENLQVLNISLNELSDDGFRLLLARHRMYNRGFQALETLDVSENVVSIRTLKSLVRFPKLRNIRISVACSLKFGNMQFTQEWTTIMKHHNFDLEQQDRKVAGKIETKGWGSELVHVWENKVAEWERKRQARIIKNTRCSSFYYAKKVGLACNKPSSSDQWYGSYTYGRSNMGHFSPIMDVNCELSDLKKGPSYTLSEGIAKKRRQENVDRFQEELVVTAEEQKLEDEEMKLKRIYLAL